MGLSGGPCQAGSVLEQEFERFSDELAAAFQVVEAAREYYEVVEINAGQEDRRWGAIQRRLESAFECRENDREFFHWAEALRLNFLGRSHYELHLRARKGNRADQSNRHLANAIESLRGAERSLQKLEYDGSNHPLSLWRGYVFRNLGLALQDVRQPRRIGQATRYLEKALEHRKSAHRELRSLARRGISAQIRIEVMLVEMDLMKLRKQDAIKNRGLEDLVDDLGELMKEPELLKDRPLRGLFGLWRLALGEALLTAEYFQKDDLVKRLNGLSESEGQ